MKKKSFFSVLIVLLLSMCVFACGKVAPFEDYTDFTGTNIVKQMTIDEGITIDGTLDEEVWANNNTKISVVSQYSTEQTPLKMDVYTYLGENGVYFAFDVKDNSLWYNPGRRQTRNTGVELYLATLDHFVFENGCASIRVSPTGNGNEAVASYYRPGATEWTQGKAKGQYVAAAVVDGEINSSEKNSNGYTVEVAVSWELLGVEKADVVHYTASFIQSMNYDRDERLDNTFISGTGHLAVGTWKAVSNEGLIADKYEYLDNTVSVDSGMTIDGKLDETEWNAVINTGKGKTFTQISSGYSLSMYTMMTELGLYIGLDCNDPNVYYNADRAAKFNTGAELLIAAKGVTELKADSVKQIRFNVGGNSARFEAKPTSDYPYVSTYFSAKIAGSVKNGTINSSDTDGWTGEIFIPWDSLGVTKAEDKEQIAILPSLYHNASVTDTDQSGTSWRYIPITSGNVYANGSSNVNPQTSFFIFTKNEGFIYNGIRIPSIQISKSNLIDTTYEVTVIPEYTDAIILSSISTVRPPVIGGSFDAQGAQGITFTDNNDGTYTMSVAAGNIDYFAVSRTITFTVPEGSSAVVAGGTSVEFIVYYDPDFSLDGIIDDNVYANVTSVVTTSSYGGVSVVSDFKFSLYHNAMYIGVEITDSRVNVSEEYGSGVEMYFNFGETLSSANTYQIRLYANGVVRYYRYSDTITSGGDFAWTELQTSEKELIELYVRMTANGYVLEAKVPWSVFGLDEAPQNCGIAPATKFYYPVKDKPDASVVRYDSIGVSNDTSKDLKNYLNFDETGFAPTALYANNLTFIKDIGLQNGDYVGNVSVGYLSGALAVSDVTFGDFDAYFTEETTGVYTVRIPQSVVEAINGSITKQITADNASGEITIVFIDASASDFDASKVTSYINFDDGLIDLVGGKEVTVTRGEAAYESKDGSYGSDKAYVSNLKARETKLSATLGTDSFTVSMLVNSDDILEYPGATYAFVLFGTGNVNGDEGFSVRVRSGDRHLSIKLGSTRNDVGTSEIFAKLGGWQRWTFVFDRETEGLITVTFYLDGDIIFVKTFEYSESLDIAEYNTLGIGSPGSVADIDYPTVTDVDVHIDDFMLYNGVMTQTDIYNLFQYIKETDLKYAFKMNDISFDFNDVDANGYSVQFRVNGYSADGTVTELTDIVFGAEIAEYITAPQGDDTYFTLNIPEDKVDDFNGGVVATYTYNGISKSVKISYTPLENLYLDKTVVELIKKEKVDGNYVFTIGVYADAAKTVAIKGATFIGGVLGSPVDNNDGTYTFTVAASVIEALTSVVTVEVEKDEANPASFTVEYVKLSDAEITDIAMRAEAILDFEDNVTDYTGAHAVSLRRGTAEYDEGAYVGNMKQRALMIDNLSVGTGSFTVSLDVNGDDIKAYPSSGYAFVLFGTGNVDGNEGFSVRVRSNAFQIKILGNRIDDSSILQKLNGWQRWTFTFDRSESGTLTVKFYLDGTLMLEKTAELDASESLDVSGYNALGIGAPGYNDDMTGGNNYSDYNIRLDNFMFVKGLLTENQIRLLDSHYDDVIAKAAWNVDDVSFSFEDVTDGQPYVTTVTINKLDSSVEITEAEFTGLTNGSALVPVNGGASYTLTIPFAEFDDYKNGVTVSVTIGGVTKTFEIIYTPFENVYVSDISMYELDFAAGSATYDVRVSANESGTVGVAGVDFGELSAYVTAGSKTGDYVLTLNKAQAEAYLGGKTIDISAGDVSGTVNVRYETMLIAETGAEYIDTVSDSTSSKQGGKVYSDIDLGTDSFTVAFMADNLDKIGTGGGFVLFSTGNTDVSKGVNVYANNNRFRFRLAGVSTNFEISHNIAQYTDWTHLMFTFDRSVAGKITITVYVNYVSIGSTTQALTADETFTYGASKNFVIGSINGEMWGETGAMSATNQYWLGAAGFTLSHGLISADNIRAYFEGLNLDDLDEFNARFDFADGDTTNAVGGSEVTMAVNGDSLEAYVTGREEGDDKAVQVNPQNTYYEVTGYSIAYGSFSVSLWTKMDFTTALTNTGSGIALYGTANPDSTSGFCVSIRKNTLRVRLNGQTQFFTIDTDNNLNNWTNITLSVERINDVCTLNVYVNFTFISTVRLELADDVSLANPDDASIFKVGSSATDDVWTQGKYENNTFTVDDVVLANYAFNAYEATKLLSDYFGA